MLGAYDDAWSVHMILSVYICTYPQGLLCVCAGKKRDLSSADDFVIPEAQGKSQHKGKDEHRKKKKRI